MNPGELAELLELLAKSLRHLPEALGSLPSGDSPSHSKRTLGEWLDLHEASLQTRGYKSQTLKNRSTNLRHVRRLWGHKPIAELKAHEILTEIRKEFLPKSTATAQRVLAELREAYNEAIANDWASNNPATHVKLPRHRVLRKRLTLDLWKRMAEHAKSSNQAWVYPMLLLALLTGQRRADLAKMKFSDIEGGLLKVEQQKQAGKGYGARVAIPLGLRLDSIGITLEEAVKLCADSAVEGQTLLRKANGSPLDESSLSIRFAQCIREVSEEEDYSNGEWPSLHEVRSLSARLYTEQGINVQTLLGHKHAEMTALYVDDRGLSSKEWKRVTLNDTPG